MPSFGPFSRLRKDDYPVNPTGQIFAREKWYQTWYKQKPITGEPMTYLSRRFRGNGHGDPEVFSTPHDRTYNPTMSAQNLKKAYDRLKDAISEPASLAVSIAERKQAFTMLEKRCVQLWKFTRAIRRGKVDEAARHLGMSQPPRAALDNRRWLRDKGGLWLEYHFGWSPLIKDIGTTLDVLQRGLPPFRVRGRSTFLHEQSGNTGSYTYTIRHTEKVQLVARVQVSDPNLWQANQLGLVNPAVVLWELVPFSFVVDWFLPVGDFLSQYTDFVGLALSQKGTTYYTLHTEVRAYGSSTPVHLRFPSNLAVTTDRSNGIATPPLVRNRVTGLSPARGATAVSLLLQSLRSLPRGSARDPRPPPRGKPWPQEYIHL